MPRDAGGCIVTRRERICQQRALAREAIGKLRAIEELFSAEEDHLTDESGLDWEAFSQKVDDLEAWIFDEGPLA
ncbi:hypothetical protein Pan1_93 [Pseudanabaena phage Pan1]|nr:hypothetical protein Pan1_93 [Pseudanabaena phage Pan1]